MQRTILAKSLPNSLANPAQLILVMLCCMVVGCALPQRQFQGPQTIQQQQLSATSFDPYADVDAGPEIVGARPREFSATGGRTGANSGISRYALAVLNAR